MLLEAIVAKLAAWLTFNDAAGEVDAENEPSLAFDGAVNTMGQGGPVPLGYGRLLVGSAIVSVGFSTNNEIMVA